MKSEVCIVHRYLTLLVYLNDVEEGGETAFPLANYKIYKKVMLLQVHNYDITLISYEAVFYFDNEPMANYSGVKRNKHGAHPSVF